MRLGIRSLFRWAFIPVLIYLLSFVLQQRGVYEPLNNWLTDIRTDQTQLAPSGEFAVVAIDAQSLKEVGTWPWSRSVHAAILDKLLELEAGMVFYDIDFAFPSDPAGDQAFADALDNAGGATLLANFAQRTLYGNIIYNQPHKPFEKRSWPAVVTVAPDELGQIRSYPTGFEINGLFIPSAGVQLAGSYASETEGFLINYGISPREIPIFSATDLLNGELSKRDIEGRSILIGAAAAELGDHFAVPLHKVIPGVLIHAVAAETLLQGVAISKAPYVWLMPVLILILLVLHFAGRQKAWHLLGLVSLAALGVEIAAMIIFKSSFLSLQTAMFHPALIALAVFRLAKTVDLSRIRIKRQEVQVENAESLRQHIFENSSDGYVAINSNEEIVIQSDLAKTLLQSEQLHQKVIATGRKVLDTMKSDPEMDHLSIEATDGTRHIEIRANVSEMKNLNAKLDKSSEPLALITLRDVTEIKQKERRIEYLSRHDDQTTALRRHSFVDAIEDQKESGAGFAVVAIALRRLNSINTTFGREIGDQIIATAVQRLQSDTLELGKVARIEGNVLGVLIPSDLNKKQLQIECQKIRDLITQPYRLADSQILIGASMGFIAKDPTQERSAEDYLSCAQDALSASLNAPSFVTRAYSPSEGNQRERSRRLEHALNQALEHDELHVLYQPQYRISDQTLIGAEALIRWESGEFGNVSPVEFVPIAESSGFINEIGRFVLQQSIESAAQLPEHLSMSPNVSALQLLSADFPEQVLGLVKRYGIDPRRLVLELTESEFISPDSEAVQRMDALKSHGITWALDDFGTGYSSLSYLKELPFDKIKLDRAFLKDIFDDQTSFVALQSIIQLIQGYGKSLLCEGVETAKDVDVLNQFGCDNAQGYYFGRPESFQDLKKRAEAEANLGGLGNVINLRR